MVDANQVPLETIQIDHLMFYIPNLGWAFVCAWKGWAFSRMPGPFDFMRRLSGGSSPGVLFLIRVERLEICQQINDLVGFEKANGEHLGTGHAVENLVYGLFGAIARYPSKR